MQTITNATCWFPHGIAYDHATLHFVRHGFHLVHNRTGYPQRVPIFRLENDWSACNDGISLQVVLNSILACIINMPSANIHRSGPY